MARRLGNISRETIPLLILFVAQQKPSRGGLWHPILMQFYSGPLMQLLSGVDIWAAECRDRIACGKRQTSGQRRRSRFSYLEAYEASRQVLIPNPSRAVRRPAMR